MDVSGVVWRKAKRSGENGGACVELAHLFEGVAVRDSKDPDGMKLLLSRADFRGLTEVIKKL
ncbi:MAG TPA: DUF397 domain-containing protein [Spirillospora sp.]|nr:DUF397 domain-containing protein [Spirillospora sp.]